MPLLTYQILTTPKHVMVLTHFLLVTVTLFMFFILVPQNTFPLTKLLILQIFSTFPKFKRIFYLFNSSVMTMLIILNFTLLSLLWRMRQPTISSFRDKVLTGSTRFIFHNSILFPNLPSQPLKLHMSLGINASTIHTNVFLILLSLVVLYQFLQNLVLLYVLLVSWANLLISLCNSTFHSNKILDLVYYDVWGPSPTVSLEGHKLFLLCVDHYTRYMWFYPLAHKPDVYSTFINFTTMVER